MICAPCGCGKTEYAVNKLPFEILGTAAKLENVLYLIDTCAGRHSIVAKHPDKARCYDKLIENGGFRFDGFDHHRIVVITYAKFGVEMLRNPRFFERFGLIIADEFHNIHWPIPYEKSRIKAAFPELSSQDIEKILRKKCYNLHAMEALSAASENPNIMVVGISATPEESKTWWEWKNLSFNFLPIADNIKHYTERNKILYGNVHALINALPKGEKTLFYADHISQIKSFQTECELLGLKCASVWSANNEKHPLSEQQRLIRQQIIETNEFPEDADVLLINKSMGTAINIYTKVPNVVVHSTNKSTQIQARGRIRNDIENLYILQPDAALIDYTDEKVRSYLNRPLSVEDKAAFARLIGVKDKQTHNRGWTTLKRLLIADGCDIKKMRFGTKNKDIIAPPEEYRE